MFFALVLVSEPFFKYICLQKIEKLTYLLYNLNPLKFIKLPHHTK